MESKKRPTKPARLIKNKKVDEIKCKTVPQKRVGNKRIVKTLPVTKKSELLSSVAKSTKKMVKKEDVAHNATSSAKKIKTPTPSQPNKEEPKVLATKVSKKPSPPTKRGGQRSAFEAYMASISRHKILSKTEELELGKDIQSADEGGRDKAIMSLVEHNLKLAATIASEYQNRGIDLEDLISEANIGLRKAAERFDPSYGAKFSTYASWWIKQAIKRFIYNKSRTIRLPIHLIEKITLIRRIKETMTSQLGRAPTCEEIAEEMGAKPREVERLLNIESQTISIDGPTNTEEPMGTNLGDIISDPSAINPSQEVADKSDYKLIKEILERIPQKEQEIVCLRFGLKSGKSLTLEEIGGKYGVSRERIRQIEADALNRIRKALNRLEAQPLGNRKSKN